MHYIFRLLSSRNLSIHVASASAPQALLHLSFPVSPHISTIYRYSYNSVSRSPPPKLQQAPCHTTHTLPPSPQVSLPTSPPAILTTTTSAHHRLTASHCQPPLHDASIVQLRFCTSYSSLQIKLHIRTPATSHQALPSSHLQAVAEAPLHHLSSHQHLPSTPPVVERTHWPISPSPSRLTFLSHAIDSSTFYPLPSLTILDGHFLSDSIISLSSFHREINFINQ
ncbi:hypothetical protein BGZ60DRAFT_115372 [Tricladium varicosporioides]|nr:hypothetical protein BGZ60DRAFT_115372 [Hymenoscyphus varicosporioides]